MITETAYKAYFGVSTAPTNLTRLEFLALEEIKSIMTCDIPASTDDNYDTFLKALMEQINYFDLNNDLISYSQLGGASLGKFNEGSATDNSGANKSRISPMTYKILLNLGYLYSGVC
jgi:hypothetical protein